MNNLEQLHKIISFIKNSFVGKDEIIDLLIIALIAKENAFLLGPPGTAKSAIVRLLSSCLAEGKNFEYLLTRFTEPNEIFGPFDIRKLKEGELVTNTEGMMPEASLIFLDEIFNANSAILNSLLMALNEKIFRRGKETLKLPALMFVGASNQLPDEEALAALLDRFLIRIHCDYVAPELLEQVLLAGWKLENDELPPLPVISPETINEIQQVAKKVDLSNIQKEYITLIHHLRRTGINISDRRAVKIQNLIAASATISGRDTAILSDLWVIKYIWDTEEQIEVLAGVIDQTIKEDDEKKDHPQAFGNKKINAEELIKDLSLLHEKWDDVNCSFEEKNIIKDKLRFLQSRTQWVTHTAHKAHLNEKIDTMWKKILETT